MKFTPEQKNEINEIINTFAENSLLKPISKPLLNMYRVTIFAYTAIAVVAPMQLHEYLMSKLPQQIPSSKQNVSSFLELLKVNAINQSNSNLVDQAITESIKLVCWHKYSLLSGASCRAARRVWAGELATVIRNKHLVESIKQDKATMKELFSLLDLQCKFTF